MIAGQKARATTPLDRLTLLRGIISQVLIPNRGKIILRKGGSKPSGRSMRLLNLSPDMDEKLIETTAKYLFNADHDGEQIYVKFPQRPLERINLKKITEVAKSL